MTERYIAFDVETPNCANDRMSAIGITVIDSGVIVDDFYSLVNPEEWFDYFNVQLTGTTPKMVADHPTFSELWTEIEPLMSSGVLIAHNAPFDMGRAARFGAFDHENTAGFSAARPISRPHPRQSPVPIGAAQPFAEGLCGYVAYDRVRRNILCDYGAGAAASALFYFIIEN